MTLDQLPTNIKFQWEENGETYKESLRSILAKAIEGIGQPDIKIFYTGHDSEFFLVCGDRAWQVNQHGYNELSDEIIIEESTTEDDYDYEAYSD